MAKKHAKQRPATPLVAWETKSHDPSAISHATMTKKVSEMRAAGAAGGVSITCAAWTERDGIRSSAQCGQTTTASSIGSAQKRHFRIVLMLALLPFARLSTKGQVGLLAARGCDQS